MARIRKTAVIGLGTAILLCCLAACGRPSPHPHGTVGPLGTIPDTAANRQNVVEDDPSWLANPTLMRKQWCRPTRGSQLAQRMALANASPESSPLGSGLVQASYAGPAPLGYRPAAATDEVTVGNPPDEMTLVQVSVPKRTEADLERDGYRRRPPVDGFPVLRSAGLNQAHTSPLETTLLAVKTVELSTYRIVGGGAHVTPTALAAVLDGRPAKHSLATDPEVDAVTSALYSADDSGEPPVQVLGSSLLASPIGAAAGSRMAPEQVAALLRRFGLRRLRTPATYAGLSYVTSSHPTCAVVAATLYPTPAAAKTAASVLGPVLRHGTSFSTNLGYDTLWTVQSIAAHGRTVVARLNLRSPYALVDSLQRIDFPLFWQPPFVARS